MPQSGISINHVTVVDDQVRSLVDDMFDYHPWDDEKVARGSRIRAILATAVCQILEDVPPGPDRTVAIRKIREARMDCNSAITHGGKY